MTTPSYQRAEEIYQSEPCQTAMTASRALTFDDLMDQVEWVMDRVWSSEVPDDVWDLVTEMISEGLS